MTLITKLVGKNFSITAGEGCTVTDDRKIDEKLRKVYINKNVCIAFAGENWINEELTGKNIFLANLIENLLYENEEVSDCKKLVFRFLKWLKAQNSKLNSELFISGISKNDIQNIYVNTLKNSVNLYSVDNNTIKLNFSYHPSKEYKLLERHFFDMWENYFKLKTDGKLLFYNEIHTIENICKFLELFYSEVWRFSIVRSFSIGKSKDIAIISQNEAGFKNKENLTVSEINMLPFNIALHDYIKVI
ncbi:MAG: hypothetical protein ACOCWG_06355 [bacterium]